MLGETPVLGLEQWLEDMVGRKIVEAMSKKSSKKQSIVLLDNPFAPEVIAVPLPRDFDQLMMEQYDGYSNSIDNLRAFVDLMRLCITPDAIMCRTFLPTLRREARDWMAILSRKSNQRLMIFLSILMHTLPTASGLRRQLLD
ncbi:Retrotrans gag domain-containing protein [Abeliophyllum distichum]|uniref:Retrotrans gag domain-containing protein n=1 Tax=Abeliophyllum distichum TaxID=126358 RepID=A0ABD1V3C5_9LAMI